jgi:enamine deaminase RidA (YjgF/YER057c/UK114 family)
MAKIEPYAAPGTWDSPTYAQAVKVTGAQTILYISGQVAYDHQGNPAHPGDFKAQARSAFQALKAQVEAGGGTMTDIAKVNFYLTDARHIADFRQIREEFLGKSLVRRICGRSRVPAVCQVHDTKRFPSHGRCGNRRIFALSVWPCC